MSHENAILTPEPAAAEKSIDQVVAQYRRCLETMRQEMADGRLENIAEAGAEVDAIQHAVTKFYDDFVPDGEEFCAEPWKWAEQIRSAGRLEEITARIEEIDAALDEAPGFEDFADESVTSWILQNKKKFLDETTFKFKDSLMEILESDQTDLETQAGDHLAGIIIRQYGQASFPEWRREEPEFHVEEGSSEERMAPFRPWADDYLKSFPRWLRSGIDQVRFLEKIERAEGGDVRFTAGRYSRADKKLSLTAIANVRVVAHESGHVLDGDAMNLDQLDSNLRAWFVAAALEEEARYSTYATMAYMELGAARGLAEDFAETWAHFLTAPEYLKGAAPKRHAAMEEIARSLELDVAVMRQAATEAEAERVGNAEMARAVFEVNGWDWMSRSCHLPYEPYTDTRWALPGWRQLQTPGRIDYGDGVSLDQSVSRDERGRLQECRLVEDNPYVFDHPTYDDQGQLTSYRAGGLPYSVRYGDDGNLQEVLIDADGQGALKTVATFHTEAGQLTQKVVTPDGQTWEFVNRLDTEGQLTETTVMLNGQPICRRPMERDERGRLKRAAYLTLDGELPVPKDELTYAYED